jgi:hypothetical protein
LMRQAPGLLHKSSLYLAFFRNPAFFLSRPEPTEYFRALSAETELPRATKQFVTALRALSTWTMTVALPFQVESRFHFRHFLRNAGLPAMLAVASRLAHWRSTSFQQPTVFGWLRWPPRLGGSHDAGGTQPSRIRLKFRGAEMTSSLPPKPPSMVYPRLERPDVNSISSALEEVKRSISEIRLPAVPSAQEVDIQHLTRHVYDHFERELRIERERRGR